MQRKYVYLDWLILADQSDPLKKREAYAVSLRKKKKDEIIKQKRRRLAENFDHSNETKKDTSEYIDCDFFDDLAEK